MNGYAVIADGYRKAMEKGKLSREVAEKEIRIYDFLATCDKGDMNILVNSGAFNDYIKAYCRKAMESAEVGEKVKSNVMERFYYIFDEYDASSVVE